MYLCNARGLIGKKELFQYLLDTELRNSVVCVTETWLNECCANSLICDSNKFTVFRLDRDLSTTRKKGGGGLLILVPGYFNAKLSCEPMCTEGFEVLSVDFLLRSAAQHQTVRLCLVYRSPQHFDFARSTSFCRYIDTLIMPGQPTFMLGDFNLPSINWFSSTVPGRGPDSLESCFLQLTLEKGLSQLVTEPTRGDNLLDLVFISEPNLVSHISVEEPFGESDHNAVKFSSSFLTNSVCNTAEQMRYNFRKANYMNMAQALDQVDWSSIFQSCSTVQQMWDSFLAVLWPLIESNVPKQKNNRTSSKWPPRIRHLIAKQKRLHRKFRQDPTPTAKTAWKSASNKARLATRQELLDKETEVLNNGTDNHFWRFVNSKLSCRSGLPSIQRNDGTFAESDGEKVEIFNAYFASVFQPDQTASPHLDKEDVRPLSTVTFLPETVFAHLSLLPSKCSSGVDGLPSILFKKLAFQLAKPLSSIFEVSFQTSTLPSDWLVSLVTPIHKKGSRSVPANYRPVSLTCVACRVMERIIKDAASVHMSKNGLISKSQHGFLSRHSTITQLLETLNDWTIAADSRSPIDVAFADISKAFDTVPHSKILESMEAYRIEGTLLCWFEAFLSGRTQSVVYSGCQSQRVAVPSGVPQGSVLGPFCFLVVMNRLPNVIRNSTIKLFADDCKLYFRINTEIDKNLFLEDLFSLFEWAQSNGLTLALDKTVVMHLGYSNPRFNYSVQQANLAITESARDLGVLFSSNLKFSEHIAGICKRAFCRTNLIFLAFYSRKPSFLVQMFKTFVRPILEYASPVWSPYLKKDIDFLERVQKYFTRRIPGLTGTYLERLELLQQRGIFLEILELRRLEADLITVYKIIYGLVALTFSDFFQWSMATALRGHSFKLSLPLVKLDSRRNFFAVRVIGPWNSLSEEAITARSLPVFKRHLQTSERSKLVIYLRGSVSTALRA